MFLQLLGISKLNGVCPMKHQQRAVVPFERKEAARALSILECVCVNIMYSWAWRGIDDTVGDGYVLMYCR